MRGWWKITSIAELCSRGKAGLRDDTAGQPAWKHIKLLTNEQTMGLVFLDHSAFPDYQDSE